MFHCYDLACEEVMATTLTLWWGGWNENYDVVIGSSAQVIDSLEASVEFEIFWSTYDRVQSVRRSVAEL